MALEAVTKALKDARVDVTDIKQACVGYVYGTASSYQHNSQIPELMHQEMGYWAEIF